MQWRMVRLIARSVAFDYKTADAAISYAIQKGWLSVKVYRRTAFASQIVAATCRLLRNAALSTKGKVPSYVECRMKTASPKRRRPSRRSPPKISAVEKTAARIMHKLHESTGGQPQRWESLGNLGAVKADTAGIACAVERDWLIISAGLHSVSLTEAGRRRVK
jgi:hypothetical protein